MDEIQVWKHMVKWGHAQNQELPSDLTNFSKESGNSQFSESCDEAFNSTKDSFIFSFKDSDDIESYILSRIKFEKYVIYTVKFDKPDL
ncbi:BTB/POZ protein [Rhizophagus irregularis DAOM 181602=DAOM 197198]|uniref:Uncharacterized protein n=1 Tax=Rhizophagus irregularis (strain DAOM 181602 / DAOM 197198 / MUCL 43194) TaxID=747089 RepID=A0A2P4QHV0_RHIID|nr:hypothetical protein GLOIN_2v1768014 [Rhizophagus irregularis DAOM 181602=DAOM 197198]POG77221.1 hypothetical protein GLOIN_2v1768014 [Rhizophagus irregularis DAOM 181602=DAOM 197198]GET65682.1 BTB/POZ protein [Rhizophagus irregularis DAOM 181602=DAOM 197198]|eukprot:XP_025184087.1 hypothetical protein GLOIN_2v1768014 [Rhizophagus irregularis DAOM 181602=DAOM 197198]